MRELLATLSLFEIDVPFPEGPDRVDVEPPSLHAALRVYAAIEAWTEGDEQAWPTLEEACRAWLPERLCDFYFGENALPWATLRDIGRCLQVGVVDREAHARRQDAVEEEVARRSWFAVIADYAEAFKVDPVQVLDTPWAFFLAMSYELIRINAARRADYAIGYRLGKFASQDEFARAMRQAEYMAPLPKADDPVRGWNPDPEWLAEQKRKVAAYQERFFGIKKGKPSAEA